MCLCVYMGVGVYICVCMGVYVCVCTWMYCVWCVCMHVYVCSNIVSQSIGMFTISDNTTTFPDGWLPCGGNRFTQQGRA